jgi:hypothetical protein
MSELSTEMPAETATAKPPPSYKLRFAAFYHPQLCEFVRALNRYGIPGLLTPENQNLVGPPVPDGQGSPYHPDPDNVETPWPDLEVDFDPGGAYSLYNWELFFHVPMLISDRLRQEQRFEEARRYLHYIFDPTTDDTEPAPERFWRVRPLRDNDALDSAHELMELLSYTGTDPDLLARRWRVEDQVAEWLDHPFEPHRIARLRLVAYQKAVVMRYLDILLEWGDALFRRDTIESITEAIQLYVLAAGILRARPQRVPARSTVAPKTYADLRQHLNDFSNAAVAMENEVVFPFATTPATGGGGEATTILSLGQMLYFCTPNNDELLRYWDHVEDRLFKIRNCLNIEGVARSLALFEPPLDPAQLVRAAAAGVDLDSMLGDAYAPTPRYRFSYLLAKARELLAEVRTLGGQLLAALEKKDAEHLSRLRAGHELALLKAVKAVRQVQVDEARSVHAALEKTRAVTQERHDFYATVEKINSQEEEQLDRLKEAQTFQELANLAEVATSLAAAVTPDFTTGTSGTPPGPTATVTWGRHNAISGAQAVARALSWKAGYEQYQANMAAIKGGHERRWDEFKLQERLAELELKQIDEQIAGAKLRLDVATTELANTELQISQAGEVERFLREKYTGTELYGWLVGQLSAVYFQAYKLAYDLAKRAERAYRFERGLTSSEFVQFGYWDGLRKGLLAGERLALDLSRLEAAYLDQHRRDYELTRRISLALHDPAALIALKATGTCQVVLPEELFDADYPGHYFRRIRSVSLTIPCVTGPYTNVNCTLTLLGSRIRTSTTATLAQDYPPAEPDSRFLTDFAAVQSIATSHAQNDPGLFELSFRDERYLPFEGAGAVSRWRIDLPRESNAFDFDTISDVVLKLDYTAREGGELLRQHARGALVVALQDPEKLTPPLRRLFSARHEFPNAWHRFRRPDQLGGPYRLVLDLTPEHYPYQLRGRTIKIDQVDLYLWPDGLVPDWPASLGTANTTQMLVTLTQPDDTATTASVDLTKDEPMPRPLAQFDALASDQATGSWVVEIPAGMLPVDRLSDLVVLFTYHPTGN